MQPVTRRRAWWINARPMPGPTSPPLGAASWIVNITSLLDEDFEQFANRHALREMTSALSSDIFSGQIIASLIVVAVMCVFLLREWIMQNARPGVFDDVQDQPNEAAPVPEAAPPADVQENGDEAEEIQLWPNPGDIPVVERPPSPFRDETATLDDNGEEDGVHIAVQVAEASLSEAKPARTWIPFDDDDDDDETATLDNDDAEDGVHVAVRVAEASLSEGTPALPISFPKTPLRQLRAVETGLHASSSSGGSWSVQDAPLSAVSASQQDQDFFLSREQAPDATIQNGSDAFATYSNDTGATGLIPPFTPSAFQFTIDPAPESPESDESYERIAKPELTLNVSKPPPAPFRFDLTSDSRSSPISPFTPSSLQGSLSSNSSPAPLARGPDSRSLAPSPSSQPTPPPFQFNFTSPLPPFTPSALNSARGEGPSSPWSRSSPSAVSESQNSVRSRDPSLSLGSAAHQPIPPFTPSFFTFQNISAPGSDRSGPEPSPVLPSATRSSPGYDFTFRQDLPSSSGSASSEPVFHDAPISSPVSERRPGLAPANPFAEIPIGLYQPPEDMAGINERWSKHWPDHGGKRRRMDLGRYEKTPIRDKEAFDEYQRYFAEEDTNEEPVASSSSAFAGADAPHEEDQDDVPPPLIDDFSDSERTEVSDAGSTDVQIDENPPYLNDEDDEDEDDEQEDWEEPQQVDDPVIVPPGADGAEQEAGNVPLPDAVEEPPQAADAGEEDLDGVLEAIGLRGQFLFVIQNVRGVLIAYQS